MTLSTTLPFKIGSTVYFSPKGVGTITSVRDEVIAGENHTMCGIKLHRKDNLIRIRANPRTLKSIADFAGTDALAATLVILSGKGTPRSRAAGKWFGKFSELEKEINTAETLFALAETVRKLSRRLDVVIPPSERPVLIDAKQRMADTLVAVTGFIEADVLRMLNQALLDSGKNTLPE